jgi:hypothetical protein
MIDQFYSDPLSLERLRFGPLGSYIDTFAQVLSAQGYARSTAKVKIPGSRRFKPLAPQKTDWHGGPG